MWHPLLAPSDVLARRHDSDVRQLWRRLRAGDKALMDLMEGVEEIPNPVLAAGLNWEWETFPEYMNELERRPRAIDIAAQIAHLPLRVYVMGDRAVRARARDPGRHRRDAASDGSKRYIAARSGSPRRAPDFAQDAGRRAGAITRRRRP